MKLSQASNIRNIGNIDYGRYFIAKVLENSAVLRGLEFAPHATHDVYTPSLGSSTVQERALGGDFTLGTPDYALQSGSLAIFGDGFVLDASILADVRAGRVNVDEWIKGQLDDKALDFAEGAEDNLWNGDGTSTSIKGLKTILDGSTDIPGLSGVTGVLNAYTLAGVSNSLDLKTDSSKFDTFLEVMDKIWVRVKGEKFIVVNPSFKARLNTIARAKHMYQLGMDRFGRPVEMINGIPIYDTTNDTVITLTEPDGAGTPSNNTTSLYLISQDPSRCYVGTNSGIEFTGIDPNSDNHLQCTFEMRGKWVIKRQDAVIRVKGFKV